MAQQGASGSGAQGSSAPKPVAKRQRMGPQECLHYANTSAGAAPLTDPSSVQQSKPDAHQIPIPSPRGKTSGSCFIPNKQAGYTARQESNNRRNYVSPSKGHGPMQPGIGNQHIYDPSGFACIGSPTTIKFNQRRGHPRSASYPPPKNRRTPMNSQPTPSRSLASSGTQSQYSKRETVHSDTKSPCNSGNRDFKSSVVYSQFSKRQNAGHDTKSPANTNSRDSKASLADSRGGIKSETAAQPAKKGGGQNKSVDVKPSPSSTHSSSIVGGPSASPVSQFGKKSNVHATNTLEKCQFVRHNGTESSSQENRFVKYEHKNITASPHKSHVTSREVSSSSSPMPQKKPSEPFQSHRTKNGNISTNTQGSSTSTAEKNAQISKPPTLGTPTSKFVPYSPGTAMDQKSSDSGPERTHASSSTSKPSTSKATSPSKKQAAKKFKFSPPAKTSRKKVNSSPFVKFPPVISPKKQVLLTNYFSPPKVKEEDNQDRNEQPSAKRDLNQVWDPSRPIEQCESPLPDRNELPNKAIKIMAPNIKQENTTNHKEKPCAKRNLHQALDMVKMEEERHDQYPSSDQKKLAHRTVNASSTLLRFRYGGKPSTSSAANEESRPDGWGPDNGDPDSMEGEPSASQDSLKSCDLTPLSFSSQPDSIADSLDAFEHDSVEDLLEDYDLTEEGHLVLSQPSVTSQNENVDDLEDDPIETEMYGYEVKQDGRVVPAQSSKSSTSPRRPFSGSKRVDEEDDSLEGAMSSGESVALFVKYLKNDGNSSENDEGNVSNSANGSNNNLDNNEGNLSGKMSNTSEHRLSTSGLDSSSESTSTGIGNSNEVDYEAMIDDDDIPEELLERLEAGQVIDQVPLKNRTFGLVGDGMDGDMDGEEERDFFEALPVEVMENIFCRIPILDLMQSCARVCQRWREIISDVSFIPWKKAYMKCKIGNTQWVSPLKESSQESCLLDLIRYLSTVNRMPGESTINDLQQHSNYEFARDMIVENLPDLVKDETPHPWSVVAALVILAETIIDVRNILTCLLHPRTCNTPMAVTEVLYCITTLLLALQRQHNLCRRLHYRVFYALFLYENDARPSSVAVIGNTPEKPKIRANGKPSFPLTHEQQRIVNHKLAVNNANEVVKVVAFAGTGKTTTLIKFAEANKYMHLLYVAFNKSVQIEASRTFPVNTECRTSHSLAWEKLKYKYKDKLSSDLKPFTIKELLPDRAEGEKSKLQWALYARLVGDSIKSFLASADEFITTRHVPESYTTAKTSRAPLQHADRMMLLRDAEYLWERMIDGRDWKAKITHDGYFKVYQLSKPVIPNIQCLLIDEAQDLTPAQQDVLLSQPVPKVLVGDPNQQIYSFRGARNAMNAIEADTVYHLTQSFRFGSEIAYMASCILDVFKDMTEQTVIGINEGGTLQGEQIGQLAIICRGNVTIFKEAVRLITTTPPETKLKLGFTAVDGFNFDKLMDLYKMNCGAQMASIKTDFFKKMQTFANLEIYANNAEDNELLGLISIVKLYHHNIPEYVQKIRARTVKKLEYATVILTTAHKAKGLEFDTVQLADDFVMFGPRITLTEQGAMVIAENVILPEDEKNLIYVAATRAKKSLLMNTGLKKCLQKASDQFKFPLSTKAFLEREVTMEQRRCLDCGQPIVTQQRVAMLKVWAVKMVTPVRTANQEEHPMNSGGFICSGCAHHHLRGFERIFLGDRVVPSAANMEIDV